MKASAILRGKVYRILLQHIDGGLNHLLLAHELPADAPDGDHQKPTVAAAFELPHGPADQGRLGIDLELLDLDA